LPEVFTSVLADLKTKTHVPVLLPGELPEPINAARYAVLGKTASTRYSLSLYYGRDAGDAGLAAAFAGDFAPKNSPREFPDARKVTLVHGLRGYFRPVSCGGSCAPANLWWDDRGVVYSIQLKLSSSVNEEKQQETTVAVANSAILAGPR
jgi:hypothetical protein